MKSVKDMNQEEYEQFCKDMDEQDYMEWLNKQPISKYQFWLNQKDYVIVVGKTYEQALRKYRIMTGKDDYFDMQILETC